ncbi:hypothetical protein [Ursidibacter sp. B-7004-1]
MLKQFHLQNKVFDDPILLTSDKGEPILTEPPAQAVGLPQYITSGDGWFTIETQEEIDGISASITGEGEVWVENGKVHFSGRKPSDLHRWDSKTKSWKTLTTQQQQAQQEAQFERRCTQLISKLSDQTDRLKSAILVGYPQAEIDSFYRQEREARGWKEDNHYPTPMLTAIAENRGVPFEILVEKVIEKADQVAVVIGQIIGQRQAFEDRISLAKNNEELTAIEQEIEKWQPVNL